MMRCSANSESALGGVADVVPRRAALDEEHLAARHAVGARGRAQRIHGFLDEQRLVAGYDINGCERSTQVLGESCGLELHDAFVTVSG